MVQYPFTPHIVWVSFRDRNCLGGKLLAWQGAHGAHHAQVTAMGRLRVVPSWSLFLAMCFSCFKAWSKTVDRVQVLCTFTRHLYRTYTLVFNQIILNLRSMTRSWRVHLGKLHNGGVSQSGRCEACGGESNHLPIWLTVEIVGLV